MNRAFSCSKDHFEMQLAIALKGNGDRDVVYVTNIIGLSLTIKILENNISTWSHSCIDFKGK